MRLGAVTPKQYLPLCGRPMLMHAVSALLAMAEIEIVFVVLTPGDIHFQGYDWSSYGKRVAPLYCGGVTRRDSVLNALVATADLMEPEDWVLVHDAARPCLGAAELRRLIDDAGQDEVGGILAVRVTDTLKRADESRRIVATAPRDGLWQAQTPQMFRQGLLLRALGSSLDVTDEAGAVEALGLRPQLVESSARNMKVTYADDLRIAAAILEAKH
ncbi:MAG: 2-C-methyl-D-erythritol 4-phosphate cytidylyltransferase [Betaproteobacteria bacterium]|nr:2-C-methyl-D-erythritol 4-phosphate cytidylyltransferase [Betaproteobacteria bacterium]